MLPEDCSECQVCGMPMWLNVGICDGCEIRAAERLGLTITREPVVPGSRIIVHRFTDPKSGKNAYWRVAGLLGTWAKGARP